MGELGGDQLAQELERLDVAVVEVARLGRVDLQHADRLVPVGERHADHRAGVDPPAGDRVDAGVLGGVVAAQDPAFADAEPGEAGGPFQRGPQVGSRLAGGHRVDHVLAFGKLDHAAAGAGQLLGPFGDQLHDRGGVEIAGGDLGLGPDDLAQLGVGALARHLSTIRQRRAPCLEAQAIAQAGSDSSLRLASGPVPGRR